MSTTDQQSSTALNPYQSDKPSEFGFHADKHDEFAYRSVSKSAVAGIIFSLLGVMAYLGQSLVLLPFLGLVFAIVSLINFKKFPSELTGKIAAQLALLISAIVLPTSLGYHAYVYATEVPKDHQRISFSDLRPNSRTALLVSEKSLEFDGKKVFLKGYVRPGLKRKKLKEFLLVGDFGDCCFGGSPKITEVVAIKILGDQTVNHGYSLRKIAGTFKLNRQARPINEKDVPQVFYEIEATEVK